MDEPLIPANKSEFWAKILNPLVFRFVEKTFSSIRIKNKHHYYLGNPNYANLLYGLHSCFHDGQVAYYVCRKVFDANFYLMVQDLYRLPILSKIGGFSVEKDSPYKAAKSINYAANLLKDKDKMLWIFPQGRVMPPDYRPIKFESGLAYITNKVQKVNLVPVAVKYTFVRLCKPEIFVEFGEPIVIDNGVHDKREFMHSLEKSLADLVEGQSKRIAQGIFDGYEYLYEDQPPLFFRMEKYLKGIIYDKRRQ